MPINEERQLGRAKNAVLSLLEQRLVVPKIYLDAEWDGASIDVLAIDREGVGDVHVACLFARTYHENGELNLLAETTEIVSLIDRLAGLKAHYKYIGAVDVYPHRGPAALGISPGIVDKSFANDGIGRVGFLTVVLPIEGEPRARIEIKPERFRAPVSKLADAYVQEHTADWEIRA